MGPSIGQIIFASNSSIESKGSLQTMSPLHVERGNSNHEESETRDNESFDFTEERNALGLPTAYEEFQAFCEESDEGWIPVTRIEKTRCPRNVTSRLDNEVPTNEKVLDIDEKESKKDLYERHRAGRKNVREERRRQLRANLKARNEWLKRVNRKDVKPHGKEDRVSIEGLPGVIHEDDLPVPPRIGTAEYEKHQQFLNKYKEDEKAEEYDNLPVSEFDLQEDDGIDDPNEPTPFTLERNQMAHAAVNAEPFDKSKENDTLAELLRSVGSAREYVEESDEQDQIDEWIGHLENMVLLGYHIGRARNFMDIFMAVASYAKMYCKKKSLVMELFRIIDEVTNTCPAEEVEPHGLSDWTGQLILEKWELFKTNTIFKRISYLISAAMSLTVCTTKRIEWSPFGLQLISVEAAKEQLKAVDVIDALIKTFVWMSETGWRCFREKSIAPILYSDQKIQQYNEECDYVLAKADAAVAGNLDDLGEYENQLNKVLKATCTMKAAKSDGPTALWLQKRYMDLTAIAEKLVAKRRNTDVRAQPLGWSLHGPTSVGKTTLGKLTMMQSLAAMGYSDDEGIVDESRILTLDLFDKYQSTWTSDILGVFLDDVGNTKAEYTTDNPHTAVIIKFFNNVAAQAIKAELNAKGVVFIDFKVGVVTTNVKDLGARCYSNCPESILRRFFHVDVSVKPEFCKKGTSMLDKANKKISESDSLTLDVWNLNIEEVIAYEVGAGKTKYEFKILTLDMDDGSTLRCEKLGLDDYLRAIIQLSTNHKREQDRLLFKAKNSTKTKFCKHCKRFPDYCKCVSQDTVKPASYELLTGVVQEAGKQAIMGYIKSWTQPVELLNSLVGYSPIRRMTTAKLAAEMQQELNMTVTPFLISITPNWLYATSTFQRTIGLWRNAAAYYDIRKPARYLTAGCLTIAGVGAVKRKNSWILGAISLGMCSSAACYHMHQQRVRQLEQEYLQKRDALPSFAKNIRDSKFPKGILFVATLAVGVRMIRMWNDNRVANIAPQTLTPKDIDAQPSWFGFITQQIGWKASSRVKGATPEHVKNIARKSQWWGRFERPDGTATASNVICPQKGIVWFPYHNFFLDADMTRKPAEWLDVTCFRDAKRVTSKVRFKAQLGYNCVVSKELDMVAVFVPNCPDVPSNVMKHLPLQKPTGSSVCTLVTRNEDVEIESERVHVTHGVYGHKYMSMHGGCYDTGLAVDGACMSMLVPEGKDPLIMGFHIGGNVGRNYGVMMTVTERVAEALRDELYSLPGVRGLAGATELPKTQYGKPLIVSEEVHPNSKFIKSFDENAIVDVIGSTKLRSESKSRVVPSILSEKVEEYFSVRNHWGAPRLKPNWVAFNATLEKIIDPSDMFLPSLLERARQDYLRPIKAFAQNFIKSETVQPLTDREMVLGVPGKRFLDAVPIKTGMGFPVFGPKNKHFTEIREGEVLVDRIPSKEVKEEMDRLMACWERNERAYPVTAATLKDEPTPVESEKVRVFQAVAVAFGLYIRKYFLPIARLLSMCPELSEAAVGINSFGPQWDTFMKHVEKFAEDGRVIAWDYSKYDVRMNSQMTYTVLQCFIDLAEVCGYSKHDLKIMNAMVADMIHPLIDYNGTMLMAYNMNTSGNNITVYINSVAGSLYVRMGFFNAYPKEKDFRECVAAGTYGDDFKGSVKKKFRDGFNFLSFQKFLAKHGMKITLPDKSEDRCADLDVNDADFLKRNSNYIPEIGTRIGKLSENSIFKSLHCNLKSKTETPTTVAISCIETAMHEWFAHGREVYNDRQEKMRKVCSDLDLPVPAVEYSFDSRVAHWKEKYGEFDGREETEEEAKPHIFWRALGLVQRIVDIIEPDPSDSEDEEEEEFYITSLFSR